MVLQAEWILQVRVARSQTSSSACEQTHPASHESPVRDIRGTRASNSGTGCGSFPIPAGVVDAQTRRRPRAPRSRLRRSTRMSPRASITLTPSLSPNAETEQAHPRFDPCRGVRRWLGIGRTGVHRAGWRGGERRHGVHRERHPHRHRHQWRRRRHARCRRHGGRWSRSETTPRTFTISILPTSTPSRFPLATETTSSPSSRPSSPTRN